MQRVPPKILVCRIWKRDAYRLSFLDQPQVSPLPNIKFSANQIKPKKKKEKKIV